MELGDTSGPPANNQGARLVSREDYLEFLKTHNSVLIEKVKVNLVKDWEIDKFEPKEFFPEEWTVWSFSNRGDWATHRGNYRGNWSPFIPRNLIHRFTGAGDLVCDPMMGSGTTLVECKLMGRNAIGLDINPDAAMVTMNRLDFAPNPIYPASKEPDIKVYIGDARRVDVIEDEMVDLVATHPPYAGILTYSMAQIPGDLSVLEFDDFITEMGKVAKESFRILKPGKHCGILIGDTRLHRHYVPIHIGVLGKFLDAGFILREDIIKLQHNTKTTRDRWGGHSYDFFKIAHEHLYVFRKPERDEKTSEFKYSKKWW